MNLYRHVVGNGRTQIPEICRMMKNNLKIPAMILLLIVAGAVLYLTFQSPQETTSLSEAFREKAMLLGYKGDALQFRSDIHLVEYFIVGIAMAIFGIVMKYPIWIPGVMGCGFGLMDECIKILLPTREFSAVDLIKDCVGVWAAVAVVVGVRWGSKRWKFAHR